jgi:hypothetical protein
MMFLYAFGECIFFIPEKSTNFDVDMPYVKNSTYSKFKINSQRIIKFFDFLVNENNFI